MLLFRALMSCDDVDCTSYAFRCHFYVYHPHCDGILCCTSTQLYLT